LGEYDTPEVRRPLQEEHVISVRVAVIICRQHVSAALSDADSDGFGDLLVEMQRDADVRPMLFNFSRSSEVSCWAAMRSTSASCREIAASTASRWSWYYNDQRIMRADRKSSWCPDSK
jgi:hypothetical protein